MKVIKENNELYIIERIQNLDKKLNIKMRKINVELKEKIYKMIEEVLDDKKETFPKASELKNLLTKLYGDIGLDVANQLIKDYKLDL